MKQSEMELSGALIGLARAAAGAILEEELLSVLIGALCLPENSEESLVQSWTERVRTQKFVYAPDCRYCANPCDRTAEFDLRLLSMEPENTAEKKREILQLLHRLAEKMQAGQIPRNAEPLIEGLTYLGEEMPEEYLTGFLQKYDEISTK